MECILLIMTPAPTWAILYAYFETAFVDHHHWKTHLDKRLAYMATIAPIYITER